MAKLKVSAAADHLERLTGKSPLVGLNELIWNALDADATTVDIEIICTALGAVDRVTVKDDGHGFRGSEVPELFDSVGGSWKTRSTSARAAHELHGTKGEGRWKALAIGDSVVWRSVTAAAEDPAKLEQARRRSVRPHRTRWIGTKLDHDRPDWHHRYRLCRHQGPSSLLHDSLRPALRNLRPLPLQVSVGSRHRRWHGPRPRELAGPPAAHVG